MSNADPRPGPVPGATQPSAGPPGRAHLRRLRDVWRSAGWPCQDMVEVELLAAGLLERLRDAEGRETVRVSDLGLQFVARGLQCNRAVRQRHDALVGRVAGEMQRAGRLVWRSLRLQTRSAVDAGPWVTAIPDVFSIRNTTVEDYVEPIVHEIKVSRADLLGDLRNAAKRAAYIALSSQCWYVLKAGIGDAGDIPASCGVLIATADVLEVARPAPRRAMRLSFPTWMALARSTPEPALDEGAQTLLGAAPDRAAGDAAPG